MLKFFFNAAPKPVCSIPGDGTWTQYPDIKRVLDLVNARPEAQRAVAFKAAYAFKAGMVAQAKKFMFPQNERLNKA